MQPDSELETWRRQWQAQAAVPDDLRRRVERDIRSRRLHVVASVAVTLTFGGGTTAWAIVSGRVELLVVAVAVWMFIAITWMTSLALDRKTGSLTPASATTAAYLDVSISSCRSRRQTIAASAVLYVAFLMFMLTWKYNELGVEAPVDLWTYVTSWRVIVPTAISAALGVLAVTSRLRLKRELLTLLALRHEVEEPDSPPP